MNEFTSFRSVIELWASREAMASDIGATASQVSKWWQRDSIPAEWWAPILAARAAQAGITAQMMTDWAARTPTVVAEPAEARP